MKPKELHPEQVAKELGLNYRQAERYAFYNELRKKFGKDIDNKLERIGIVIKFEKDCQRSECRHENHTPDSPHFYRYDGVEL